MSEEKTTDIDERVAQIILDAFRRHCGFGPYVYDHNRLHDINGMRNALDELGLREAVRRAAE